MKFSTATLAAIAAYAMAATVSTDPQIVKQMTKFPDSMYPGVYTVSGNLYKAANEVLKSSATDLTLVKPIDKPDDNAIVTKYDNKDEIRTDINNLANYAEGQNLQNWQKVVSFDDEATYQGLFSDVINSADSPEVQTQNVKDRLDSLLQIYFAQEVVASIMAANPNAKILTAYTIAPATPPTTGSDDVTKAINNALKSYTQHLEEAIRSRNNAIQALYNKSKDASTPAVSDAASKLADKVTEQNAEIIELQAKLTNLQGALDAKDAPKDLAQTMDAINDKAADVSQKQEQTAQETAKVAEDSDSDVLKAISEELAAQAEAIKQLTQGKTVEEAPKVETPVVETPVAQTPVAETPAVQSPAVETPAVQSPAVETPAVESPAVVSPAVETPAVETTANATSTPAEVSPVVAAQTPVAPAANAVANSNSNSESHSESNSNSESNANANVNIYLVGGSRGVRVAPSNGTLAGVASGNSTDTYVTVYETDCPVTTTNAAGSTVTTHTKSTVTSTVCPKCTKTPELEDVVTVFVTDCPVTTTDAAGATHTTHTQSTVTSTVCTKCTQKTPAETPKAETPKFNNGTVTHGTLTQSAKALPSNPAQQPKVVPEQANGAAKAVAGAAALAIPMVMALL